MKRKPKEIIAARPDRPPDCVTVTRIGNTILTVNGFCNPNAKETVDDKLFRIMKAEIMRNQEENGNICLAG